MHSPVQPTHRNKSVSISRRARLFIVLVCLGIVAIHSWQSWYARKSDLKNSTVSSGNTARGLAQHAYDTVQAVDGLLLDVTDRVTALGIGSPLVTEMAPMLERLSREMPQLDGLYVYDELGQWVVNSVAHMPADANNSDRDYFAYHRSHDDHAPLVGRVLRSRATGHWVVPVSRRINHRDGSFAGVALATLNLDYFTRLYGTFDLGTNGSVGLLLRNGTLLTRMPFDEKFVNRDFSDSPLFRDMLPSSASGSMATVSRLDSVRRMLAYQSVTKYPLLVTVAISEDEALADWRQETLVYSVAVLLLLVMIGAFGWRLVSQIELRQEAERLALNANNELAELNRRLETLVNLDGLTGLANRRHFDEMLDSEYRRAARGEAALSLVLIDVDFFKQYNDIYGHQAGDECLRQVAGVLSGLQRRPADLAARYGGEEMLMLLPATDSEGAARVAENIRAGIQALGIAHRSNPTGVVTVSAGVHTLRTDGQHHMPPMEELVGQADAALYQAKHGGRNQVRVAAVATPATMEKVG